MNINLTKYSVATAMRFATQIVASENQGQWDFGNKKMPRNFADRVADCFQGKLGEIAFSKFANKLGVTTEVDFSIYEGKSNTDGGSDIIFKYNTDVKMDVKAVKPGSQWLLVEKPKANADVYVCVRTDLPFDIENNRESLLHYLNMGEESGDMFSHGVSCEILGWCSGDVLRDVGTKCFEFKIGDRLFDTSFLSPIKPWQRDDSYAVGSLVLRHETEKKTKFIGPRLKAPVNLGYPISWLNKNLWFLR